MKFFDFVCFLFLIGLFLDYGMCDSWPYPLPGGEGDPIPNPSEDDARCEKAVDIAFVVDSSSSVYVEDFKLQRKSIHDIVNLFDVRPDAARVSAVSFSDKLYPEFNFNEYNNKDDALSAIDNIVYSHGGATRTYLALEHMRDVLYDTRNGARDGVPHVAVVFTDGETNPGGFDAYSGPSAKAQTIKEATAAKGDGIFIFAVGIGPNVNKTELKAIASPPSDRFMITVPSFSAMNTVEFRNFIAYHICTGADTTPEPPTTTPAPETTEPNEDPKELCQSKPADIIFVLDESSSIHSKSNFDMALQFINDVIDFFQIGSGAKESRVGVIGFSDRAHTEFQLNTYTNKDDVQDAVSRIHWGGGNTFTDKALKLLLNSFTPENGARGNVAQIAIIITDGNSTNPWRTKEKAQEVQGRGIYSFAIGIGPKVYDPELDILASDPNHQYKFKVDTLGALNTIKELLAYSVCKEKKKNETAENVCGQKEADIVFIADASTSIGERDFEKQRDFIYNVVHKFDIGPDATQVGLITFSNQSHLQFDLKDHSNKQELHSAIKEVRWTGGMTYTAGAIEMMIEHFRPVYGARPNVPKVGIIITDGWSYEPTKTVANAARAQRMGITMFSIGVGKYIVPEELDQMATDPDDYHSFMVDDYSALNSISDALAVKACDIEASRKEQGKRWNLRNLLTGVKRPINIL